MGPFWLWYVYERTACVFIGERESLALGATQFPRGCCRGNILTRKSFGTIIRKQSNCYKYMIIKTALLSFIALFFSFFWQNKT